MVRGEIGKEEIVYTATKPLRYTHLEQVVGEYMERR